MTASLPTLPRRTGEWHQQPTEFDRPARYPPRAKWWLVLCCWYGILIARVRSDIMIDTDTHINALLNAIAGFHSELQVIRYGSPKRLIIYYDLLCCYREIFRLLRTRRDLPYNAEQIRSVVSPRHAHLN